MASIFFASCKDRIAESQIAAQVGNATLTHNEVRMQIPFGLTGADSAAFANKYIDAWIDRNILYEQALRNLPEIDKLNEQAEEYRKTLISQTYENELLNTRLSGEITEDECQEFYDKNSKHLRLEQAIVQGVYVKLLNNSSKVKEIKKWLAELSEDKTDCIEEFEQYGTTRATDFDNFFDSWVSLLRLSDKLPVTIVDPATFLKRKAYELKDDEYYYLFVIKDFRLAGDIAPYDFAKPEIYNILVAQKRKNMRRKLMEELRNNGAETGFLKRF